MTPGAILTLGLGTYSDVNHLVTLGYGTGAEPPPEPPEPPAPEPQAEERPAGGILHVPSGRRRSEEDVRRARELFGIPQPVAEAIADVAARQAERLEQDAQKRFEELERELALRGLEWEGRYLEALNEARERLISEEIGRYLRRQSDDEVLLLLLAVTAAAV